jgi:hypothetical protein
MMLRIAILCIFRKLATWLPGHTAGAIGQPEKK